MQKIWALIITCSLICMGAYRWGDTKWENAKIKAIEYMYIGIEDLMVPYLQAEDESGTYLLYRDVEHFFTPLLSEFRATQYKAVVMEEETMGQDNAPQEEVNQELPEQNNEDSTIASTVLSDNTKKVVINRIKLQDFDYLRQNFYQVDNTTTISGEQLNVDQLLGRDMTIQSQVQGPKILIYHTHSQEAYKDSVPGDASTSIVAVGDYLESLLEQNYGIDVLHHKGQYDVESRDNAYSRALPEIERVLKENPSIEVVIDLHRDGVPEDRHLVTEINGKPTAKIMFFNGLSRTTSQGELEYLANPYLADNLALSFQMQLAAAEYYPGFTRKIYLKGYRYNMHLCGRTTLIELGAQNNTVEEIRNACYPIAHILDMVLSGA